MTAVNDAPVNTVPGAQVVNEDTNLGITGLSIADADAGSGTLTTALSVGSGTLTVATVGGGAAVAGSGTNTVTLTGTLIQINTTLAALGAVLYTGNADFNGADTLTMTTNDGGNTGLDPGLTPGPTSESDTDTVGITVNAVNDAPVNVLPASVTAPPDTDQAIAGLSIADVDVGAGTLITQLQVGNGILTVAPVGGAGVVGSGTNMVTLTGTLADINATLSAAGNVVYHGNTGFFDTDTLTMTTSDNGFTGSGGPLADIDLMSIQVRNAVNTDLNADSQSDILWQSSNGTAAAWLMDGTTSTFVGPIGPFNPGPSWHVKATGDLNGDGKADIVWQHDNGAAALWLMDGSNVTFAGQIGPFNPGPNWEIEGTGDFNGGDGKSDIIWQHDNGLTAMWQMDGTNATFVGAVGPFNPEAPWDIKATGDLNGDSKADIIWQHDNGAAAVWLMDGTDATFVGAIGPFNPGPSWEIKGTGDFNGDSKADILWQNDDGTPAIWLMDGTDATFVGAIGPFNPGPSWEIKGTGDFNGDSKADILWQNDDGTPVIWTMDGTNVVSNGAAGSFNPGSDWQVII